MRPKCACGNALQLHLDFPRFHDHLQTRIRIFRGDLTAPQFGLSDDDYERLDSYHRFGHSLCGVAEPEIREELSECESARDVGSRAAGHAGRNYITACGALAM